MIYPYSIYSSLLLDVIKYGQPLFVACLSKDFAFLLNFPNLGGNYHTPWEGADVLRKPTAGPECIVCSLAPLWNTPYICNKKEMKQHVISGKILLASYFPTLSQVMKNKFVFLFDQYRIKAKCLRTCHNPNGHHILFQVWRSQRLDSLIINMFLNVWHLYLFAIQMCS